MLRALLCSAAMVGMTTVGLAADTKDANKNQTQAQAQAQARNRSHVQATVTKVDAKKNTITLKMKDKTGKTEEQTFNLTNDVKMLDPNGKTVEANYFKAGEHVQVVEHNGKLAEIERERKGHRHEATITKVDAKDGTVTVQMKDKNGKEVEKTFHLTGESRYFDSTGREAATDIFQSGNQVLVLEEQGKVVQIQQKGNNSGENHHKQKSNKEKSK